MNIVVAGASGFVGRALIPHLLEKFPQSQITALSRNQQSSDDPRVEWRPCDLFSLKALEQALPSRIDLAFYLVHSMGPTAALDQGSFADYDLILADNFARAVEKTGIRHLIYLGGLTPEKSQLSLHLRSRLEVEETFQEHKLPITIFRAGLVLGDEGSSSQILIKLVRRLPVMICPKWTQTLTTPVDLATAVQSLTSAAMDESCVGRTFDLAGCQPITYVEMMKETARKMGLRRYFLAVPFFTPTLSRLWVSLVTNSSRDLVYPLVESLEHPMVARPNHLLNPATAERSYFELLDKASLKSKRAGRTFLRFQAQRRTVRSVQRLPLPAGRNAEWIKDQYAEWLPRFLAPFIGVEVTGPTLAFSLFSRRFKVLGLKLNSERSDPDRQLLNITDGLLVNRENKGRLEFRVVLSRQHVLAAIHDFKPALPWMIYRYSQAVLHLWVMKAFSGYLADSTQSMHEQIKL